MAQYYGDYDFNKSDQRDSARSQLYKYSGTNNPENLNQDALMRAFSNLPPNADDNTVRQYIFDATHPGEYMPADFLSKPGELDQYKNGAQAFKSYSDTGAAATKGALGQLETQKKTLPVNEGGYYEPPPPPAANPIGATSTAPATGATGAAPSSNGDFLFGGTPPSTFTSIGGGTGTAGGTGSSDMPAWWQTANQALIAKASAIASQPYQTYSGPRVAGLDPLQTDAANKVADSADKTQGLFGLSTNMTAEAGQPFDAGEFNKVLSPYTTGVTDRIAQLGARNLSENLLPEVNDTFTKAGQFGSSRHADFTGRAVRDTNESVLGQQANSLEQAYNDAMGNYQTGAARQLEAGKNVGALAALQSDTTNKQAAAEDVFGIQNQNQAQKNLDLGYSDFVNQQNAPLRSLDIVNTAIRGATPSPISLQAPIAPNTAASPLTDISALLASYYGGQKT